MRGWWTVSYIVLWVVVVVLAVLVVALARQVGTLHLRLGPRGALEMDDEGPPLGDAPEPVDATDTEGRPATIGGPGEPQLLLFVSPTCPVCRDVLPSVRPAASVGRLSPFVIADADGPEVHEAYKRYAVGAPVVVGPEIASRYSVPGTPYAVVLDALGIVRAKGTVNNLEQMEGLVETARRRLEEQLPSQVEA